jgi:hypothetical protein
VGNAPKYVIIRKRTFYSILTATRSFSLVPFACYVVLAGNTVASLSTDDLELLASALSAIEPISTSSKSGQKLYHICKSFYQVASFSIARQAAVSEAPAHVAPHVVKSPNEPTEGSFSEQLEKIETPIYEHVMLPQDWDAVMNDFDVGVGVGAMASFIEPYLSYPSIPFPQE